MASSSRAVRCTLRSIPLLQRSSRINKTAILPVASSSDIPSRRSKSILRGYATSTSEPGTTTDPSLTKALDLIELGTRELEEGDIEAALKLYQESLEIHETSGGFFNIGVCEYHLKNNDKAIKAWQKSIDISPSADAYTNLASAYILSKPPQPALAIKNLTSALELSPEDPEIAFNLAAVLESTDNLETALTLYQKAHKLGIERAAQNVRSVGAKILAKVKEKAT